jgi:hypothetical protein
MRSIIGRQGCNLRPQGGYRVSRPEPMQVTPQREAELRQAHQRAFEKIRAASTAADYQHLVAAAVEELVDACEAYIARTA